MDKPKKGRKPMVVSDRLRRMILASKADGMDTRTIARTVGLSYHAVRVVCGRR